MASEIDLVYAGPSPAINGCVRSEGQALQAIAGATSGGVVFVKRAEVSLERREDYARKRFAPNWQHAGHFVAELSPSIGISVQGKGAM